MDYELTIRQLRRWGRLGVSLRARALELPKAVVPSFEPAKSIIAAANTVRRREQKVLNDLLNRSRTRLAPLGEPLEQEFGLNRWLSSSREEAYSDWLSWLFERMSIFDFTSILGLSQPRDAPLDKIIGEREVWIEPFSEDANYGRLDIVVRTTKSEIVMIEVKKGDIGIVGIDQIRRYKQQLKYHPFFSQYDLTFVLLSGSMDISADDVVVRDYNRFSRNLRRLAFKWITKGTHLPAASCLMVVGAIEQNLLGISVSPGRSSPLAINHLRSFLADSRYEQWDDEYGR